MLHQNMQQIHNKWFHAGKVTYLHRKAIGVYVLVLDCMIPIIPSLPQLKSLDSYMHNSPIPTEYLNIVFLVPFLMDALA